MKLLRRKPWLLVVAAITVFVLLDLLFVVIAISNPPIALEPR